MFNYCIPETIKFDFRVILLRIIKYLQDNCLTKSYHTDLFLLLKKSARTFSRHLVFDVLFYERKDCPVKGDSEATINSLSSQKCLDTLRNTFEERSTQYTSVSSRKQPANADSDCKQFTENASVVLQQTVLTHAHTKCPPVFSLTQSMKGSLMRSMGRPSFPGDLLFWNVSIIVLHSSVVIRPSHDCLCSSDT